MRADILNLFQLLHSLDNRITPNHVKIHLAVSHSGDNPLDLYLNDEFESWQSWQNKRNFDRKFIVALAKMDEADTWLFIGVYESLGCVWNEDHYDYSTSEIAGFKEYAGRIIVNFSRQGRQSYLIAENWVHDITIKAMTEKKCRVQKFKGYEQTKLSKCELDIIIEQQESTWKTALSCIQGVYLITDLNSGKLYVGSATGEGGIWQRWRDYAHSCHGGNAQLKTLLVKKGREYFNNLQYSVLEVVDTHETEEYVRKRENHWKDVLASRVFGYNNN